MAEIAASLFSTPHLAVATAAALLGILFGVFAESSQFCLLGGLREATQKRQPRRLAAYAIAVLVALAGTQALIAGGWINLEASVYLASATAMPAVIVGGLLFGFGAALTRGCAGRLTVLAATGNLRALLVIVVLGLVAYATMRGIFAPVRLPIEAIAKPAAPYADLASGFASWGRFAIAGLALAGAVALLRRAGTAYGLAAIGIGLVVAGGWAASAILGDDGFDKLQPWSAAFVAPLGNGLQYLLTFTGSKINFGIAFAGGVLAGAFVSSLIGGRARLQSFESPQQTLRYLGGAALMGFGGVLALGCTTGQGLAGIATLAPASFVALGSIAAGMAAGLAWDRRKQQATEASMPAGALLAAGE
jgi:uncharacterized membrane protein YedE/YeeE